MGSCYHSLLPPLDVFPGNDPQPGLLLHLLLVRAHDSDVVHLKADTSNAANNAHRVQSKKRSQNLESIKGKIDTGKNNPWLISVKPEDCEFCTVFSKSIKELVIR